MIYFDHAATTPVDEDVREVMIPFFSDRFGNPSSIYSVGRDAKDALSEARNTVAELLSAAKPSEIIFTSGATEANNLALKGVALYASQVLGVKPHIIVSAIEHHCVLHSAQYLEKYFGFEVTYLPVNSEGLVDPEDVHKAIQENTTIISVMFGNNEVGTVEPIADISDVIKNEKLKRKNEGNNFPLVFHTDAVQAFQYLDIDVEKLGVDMLSLTGHKFYGPKGVGLLYVKRGTKFLPQQQGGAQERNLRAGTENVSYIVGFAKAMSDAVEQRKQNVAHVLEVRDYLEKRISEEIPDVELLGPKAEAKRLPHISAFLFKHIEGESILINLDLLGIAASSGSACTSGSLEPSHVTKAMGYEDIDAHGAVRFSFGKLNKKEDVDTLMKDLPNIIEKLRAMSPIK